MDIKDILAKCDHTLLGQAATWNDIKGICDDGMKYSTASVCIVCSAAAALWHRATSCRSGTLFIYFSI